MSDRPRRALDTVRSVRVVRVDAGAHSRRVDEVAVEEPLEIRLHDRPFAVVMRTPGADRELAAGFLLSEGIIEGAGDAGAIEICRHPDHPDVHNVVNVFLMGVARERLDSTLAERRNVVANSSCGICGRVTIESLETRARPLSATCRISAQAVAGLPDSLRETQAVFDKTGGLHGAALFTPDGALVTHAEDVGRHNAVDKCIGSMLLEERLPLTGLGLIVSGRVSFEIVQKAWLAGVEIICAVSAPSSLAVELAERAGITLIGFARDLGFNVYSYPRRIQQKRVGAADAAAPPAPQAPLS